MATTQRQTAGERRVAVLEAAKQEFGRHGLHGASTEAIARRAGISQPYLFRLFGTKKELFLAVTDSCFADTLETFREAASGTSGGDALKAIGEAYVERLMDDRAMLQCQLQAYAAAVHDGEVRESTTRGFGRLVDYVEAVSGADRRRISTFFATGMLLNVLATMDHTLGKQPRDGWIARLVEGCKGGASE